MDEFEAFLAAYIEAALWSTTDESDEEGGEFLDRNYGREHLSPETLEKMTEDCRKFLERGQKFIDQAKELANLGKWRLPAGADCTIMEFAGHHFWLTRNGHGCGFWDGDWPEDIGESLDKISEDFKSFYLYVSNSVIYDGC